MAFSTAGFRATREYGTAPEAGPQEIATKSLIVVAAVLAAALTPAASQAAAPGYRHHYADLAVAQRHWDMETPGCFKGSDNRWRGDWGRHYGWRPSADYWAARAEDSYRSGRIHQCRMNVFGHP